MDKFVGNRKFSINNYAYFGLTTTKDNSGKKKIVKAGQYKYGKSKINSTSTPGSEIKIPSIDEINNEVNQAFEDFKNSKQNSNNAKTLINKINRIIKVID
jgi:outer membrane murein-binding lipoprotein Lpp